MLISSYDVYIYHFSFLGCSLSKSPHNSNSVFPALLLEQMSCVNCFTGYGTGIALSNYHKAAYVTLAELS